MTDSSSLTNDVALARDLVAAAGELLIALRNGDHRDCGARGDRAANDLILDRLKAARPDDFILSEEAVDDPRRCAARRVWIVDPLDGTREFAEGRDDWAVHVGLAVDGNAAAGAVALPVQGRVFDSVGRLAPRQPGPYRIAVSRTRAPAQATAAAAAIGAELVPMGSAGFKAMAVVAGRVDAYLHLGGQREWDSCAPVAVALGAGLHASRVDGSALTYNCFDTNMPDLLICRPELAAPLLQVLAAQ